MKLEVATLVYKEYYAGFVKGWAAIENCVKDNAAILREQFAIENWEELVSLCVRAKKN